MELPNTDGVDVPSLAKVFNDKTNSYKFYWFLAILDHLQKSNAPRIPFRDLAVRMVELVWYPLDYFRLSFGTQDGFKPIADHISRLISVDNSINAPDLFWQLRRQLSDNNLEQAYRVVDQLSKWVPYRFIRPFFEQEVRRWPDGQVNKEIARLSNQNAKPLYRIGDDFIELNENWINYLNRHLSILRGFTHWHLIQYLQKNNPNVTGLSDKLSKPAGRDFKLAKPFWKAYLEENSPVTCIYSGQSVTADNFSLDHFLPFSFVAHDQLWNLIPTTKSVNSSKSDLLPDTDLYLDKFAQVQFDAFQFYAGAGHVKKLEDYSILFRESTEVIHKSPFLWFHEKLTQSILPQLQTAQNMGFSYPFIYRNS